MVYMSSYQPYGATTHMWSNALWLSMAKMRAIRKLTALASATFPKDISSRSGKYEYLASCCKWLCSAKVMILLIKNVNAVKHWSTVNKSTKLYFTKANALCSHHIRFICPLHLILYIIIKTCTMIWNGLRYNAGARAITKFNDLNGLPHFKRVRSRNITGWLRYIDIDTGGSILNIIYFDNIKLTLLQRGDVGGILPPRVMLLGARLIDWSTRYINNINHQSLLDARNGWWARNRHRIL